MTCKGTARSYKNGCRCDQCRAANAAAVRQWRKANNTKLPQACPVEHDGKLWPSQAAAGRDLGRDPGTIRYHLNRWGHLGNIGGKTGPKVMEAAE